MVKVDGENITCKGSQSELIHEIQEELDRLDENVNYFDYIYDYIYEINGGLSRMTTILTDGLP